MTKIIMHGCNGKMGQVITDICNNDPEAEIVAGIDISDHIKTNPYPVFKTVSECNVDADVVIDFSTATCVDALLDWCKEKRLPLVLCTTALSDETVNKVMLYSKEVAILRSANMSVGINMLLKELKNVASLLAPSGFDIEIVEKHHNQKIDAPSGTALALADSINESLGNEYNYVYDRTVKREKRSKKEIGISAVRGGSIVGEHEVIFAGRDEVITITHTAYSKAIFANGAVQAAKFLKGKPAGLYDMSKVI
ncbi:MAG: 4-hydroxy-tetrahydrodipicolinate reductase [Lachnospiraceae bacterium]|nr:4-hydroxy-tetrahydrodipicolinate reductase [Lachnospiraceae bacterium]